MTPFLTVLWTCFIIMVIMVSIHFIIPYAIAQQEDNKTIVGGIEVPPSSLDQNAIDLLHKSILVAQLHNASNDAINILFGQYDVYKCLDALVNSEQTIEPSYCDVRVTDLIVNHELGNNQTIINLAHTYLKARGIQ
jgi:hypothetical protein